VENPKERRVLCVCFGNSCRSPMIQGLARQVFNEACMGHIKFESAGTSKEFASKGVPATDKSVIAMNAHSIDISKHINRYAGDLQLSGFDLFLTTGQDINDSLIELGVLPDKIMVVGGANGIPNPWQKDQDAYSECAEAIRGWLNTNTWKIVSKVF